MFDDTPYAKRCIRCDGRLIVDDEASELVCFGCSRRFNLDGTTTEKPNVKPGRNDERIAGMRF